MVLYGQPSVILSGNPCPEVGCKKVYNIYNLLYFYFAGHGKGSNDFDEKSIYDIVNFCIIDRQVIRLLPLIFLR